MKPAKPLRIPLALLAAVLCGCSGRSATPTSSEEPSAGRGAAPAAQAVSAPAAQVSAEPKEASMPIQIKSPAFNPGGAIPSKFTCDGEDTSPPLEWSGIPPQAKSLALLADDPDAPVGDWVHWIVYDIPPSSKGFAAGAGKAAAPEGAKDGTNSWEKTGWGGPCPPSGTHRYFFKLYALDAPTGLAPGATKEQLLKAMEGHILGRGELIGRYQRKG